MSKTKTVLATLALGAAVAYAGPTFAADKMKVTLTGAAEVPPVTTARKGTADVDFDPATKKLSWKLTYPGLSGPATPAPFPGPGEPVQTAGAARPIPNAA